MALQNRPTQAHGRQVFLQFIFGLMLLGGVLSSCSPRLNSTPKSAGDETSSTSTTSTAATPSDTTAPTVTAVVATNADGGYVVGDTITIEVTFSEAVTVSTTGGTPYIKLETGTTDRNASYTSGSATTTLSFSHVLVSGDQNADLDYQSTAALQANGGTIKDAAGNDAVLTLAAVGAVNSISDNQAVVVCAQTNHTALGSGTRASPHLLCQADQLASVGANSGDWGLHYKLMHNIDLTGYTEAADGTQWIPIGTSATPFTGTFEGNSKTISNLTYNDNTKDYVAIFGYMAGERAEIKNLTITGLNLNGNRYTGGLLGYLSMGRVININTSGTISADNNYTGGVVAYTDGGMIADCKSSVAITSTSTYVGGIAGYMVFGLLFNSYNTGAISGGMYSGGIAGASSDKVAITNVYNSGNITATNYRAGGILGSQGNTRVTNCFSTGNVTAIDNGGTQVGPLHGGTAGTWTNCYYSSSATITNTGTGNATNTNGGTAVALATFYNSANAPLSSWDFTNTWNSTGSALPTHSISLLSSTWGTCASHTSDTPFAGGVGTASNPYLICTGAQMNAIGSSTSYWSNKHYKLVADISLSAYTGTQYNVIGTAANYFEDSSFSGEGHVISNFSYTVAGTGGVGLFGYVTKSYIGNLGLEAPAISGGGDYIGGIAGTLGTNGYLYGSYVKGGSLTGTRYIGGLVGNMSGFVRNSYSTASVTGTVALIGGLGGNINGGNIANLFTTGSVSANGGAVTTRRDLGGSTSPTLSNIYYNSNTTCTNCSAAGLNTAVDVGGVDPSTYFYDKTKAPLSSWDFTNTWLENAADYPSFQP